MCMNMAKTDSMSHPNPSPYLERLLDLYSEKRQRFQALFTLLLAGSLIFFFLVLMPYFTLLGNRSACEQANIQCSQPKAELLDARFSEVTTSWGKIPISTAEIVALSPLLYAVGIATVSMQLLHLMRLRYAIDKQAEIEQCSIDTALVAPTLLYFRPTIDWLFEIAVFLTPSILCFYSISLIFRRNSILRLELPYAQTDRYYQLIYGISIGLIGFSLIRVGLRLYRSMKRERA